jgi:hypothetical protein
VNSNMARERGSGENGGITGIIKKRSDTETT